MITYEKLILIDPSYSVYENDVLFESDSLNRDDSLLPFKNLKRAASLAGVGMHTADMFLKGKISGKIIDYYSLGLKENYIALSHFKDINFKTFFILEPPVVQSELYDKIQELSQYFQSISLHNTAGSGYDSQSVDIQKLKKWYWCMPYHHVIEKYWNNISRKNRVVIINSNLKPQKKLKTELYSKRIETMVQLMKDNIIDLYGRGWNRWYSRSALWMPYWKNIFKLLKIYKGPCDSKFEILSQYDFCLCFENMIMPGYITEKIFDCFYAGCIPIYLGAPDITEFVPTNAFIDARQFSSDRDIAGYIKNMTPDSMMQMRMAAKNFIESEKFDPFYHSLRDAIPF